jgi:MFS family permease
VRLAAAIRARVHPGSLIDTRFAIASLVDAIGTGCFLAGSALFFTRDVGLSPGEVGLGLTLSGVIGFLTTVPWGRAADRWGAQRILVTLLVVRAVAFGLYAFATSFVAFLAIAVLLGLVEKSSAPIQQVLIGDVVGEERRQRALAVVRTMRNAGFALGAVAATAAVSHASAIGYDGIVLLNAVSFVVAAVLMGSMRADRARRSRRPPPVLPKRLVRDRSYAALTALNGVLTLHMSLLSVGLPLWLIEHTSAPAAAVPLLLLVNTVLAVAFQVPVAGLVRSSRGAGLALAVAGVALAACCLAMPLAAALGGAGAVAVTGGAVLALTLAELAQSAGGWDLSFRQAPEAQRGRYLSVFSLGTTGQTIVGPLLLTSVVFALGWWGWAALAAVVLSAGLLVRTVISEHPPASSTDRPPRARAGRRGSARPAPGRFPAA